MNDGWLVVYKWMLVAFDCESEFTNRGSCQYMPIVIKITDGPWCIWWSTTSWHQKNNLFWWWNHRFGDVHLWETPRGSYLYTAWVMEIVYPKDQLRGNKQMMLQQTRRLDVYRSAIADQSATNNKPLVSVFSGLVQSTTHNWDTAKDRISTACLLETWTMARSWQQLITICH